MPKNYSTWNQEQLDKEVEKARNNFKIRLKFARMSKGLSQEQLATKLNCSFQTISNWENRTPALSFETLIKLSLILECDLAFLTGKIDQSTHDIRFIQDNTGLSERAICKISNPYLENPFGKTLSRMIESERFYNLITSYKIFLEFLSKMKVPDHDDTTNRFELNDDCVVLGINEAINHFKQEVTTAMNNICEDEQYSQMMKLEKRSSYQWTDPASVRIELKNIDSEIKHLEEHKQFLESEVLPTVKKKKRSET